MIVDLLHNKIIEETATDKFISAVHESLIPLLIDKYGDDIEAVLMYEDHLADDFLYEGEWYYPLSVTLSGEGAHIVWIKWAVNKKQFRGGVPYSYIGEEPLEISLASFVPATFSAKLSDRRIDYSRDAIPLTVDAVVDDPTLLVGKYSQTFVDEMAEQVTSELCRALGVLDFKDASLELKLVFAPGTYLEHTSENVTYRRLLMIDKGCQPRDFWVKWTRLDSSLGFKVSDNVSPSTVSFTLGEDVAQKIREKEYRFLCNANPDKYQSAMGKKTVTEWRDITKRAIKRGELVKTFTEPEISAHADDVSEKLKSLLANYGKDTSIPEIKEEAVDTFDYAALAKSVLGDEPAEEPVTEPETALDEACEDEPTDEEVISPVAELPEETEEEPLFEQEDEPVEESFDEDDIPAFEFAPDNREEIPVIKFDEYVETVKEAKSDAPAVIDEEAIRRDIEAKIRLEYETEARLRAEREAEQLRREYEKLLEEKERLAKLQRDAEEKRRLEEEERLRREEEERAAEAERLRIEEEKRAEEARIRAEIEAQMRLEAEERARIAEAARIAVEEQKRLEAEREEREAREREEAFRREAERLRREEESRREEDRKRLEELKRLEDEARRRREEEEAKARVQLITKQARLMFRYAVDLNVIKRIKDVVEETLVAHKKEKLNIHIRAYPLDSNSIALEIRLPQNESDLLVGMMKALGNASLGITKIVLE